MNALKANKFRVGEKVKLVSVPDDWKKIGDTSHLIDGESWVLDFVSVGVNGGFNYLLNSPHSSFCLFWIREEHLGKVCDKTESKLYSPLVAQEGGGHYKNRGIQPLEYTMKNNLSFCEGNVVKYISRYKSKNGIEDLAKVIHYALLASYEEYGEQGSSDLKEKVLKLLGEHG